MEKTTFGQKITWVLKAVLASYIVTGLLLLIISFLVYKIELKEEFVNAGIVVTYLFSTFVGGFIVGKLMKYKKFLWGILVGMLYIGLLYAISYTLWKEAHITEVKDLIQIGLCIGGGMLGGMLA